MANGIEVHYGDGRRLVPPNGKLPPIQLGPGDAYVLRGGGGGGFGNPLARPPDEVRRDVESGDVSLAAAREHYRVVIDPVTLQVDAEATEALRQYQEGHGSGRPAGGQVTADVQPA